MKYCIANWKMNMSTGTEVREWLAKFAINTDIEYAESDEMEKCTVIICPPYVYIREMYSSLYGVGGTTIDKYIEQNIKKLEFHETYELSWNVQIGSQDINPNDNGAYTGEISIDMITKWCVWSIVGHSERRILFNESNEYINLKVKALLAHNMRPILCIGETLEEREAGKTKDVLCNQLKECLKDISCSDDFLIAYEPVWAIGTGKTANNDTIESANDMILNILKELKYDIKNPKILYGGSVNNNNAKNLSKICNLDGFLIGGASLDAEQFHSIYNALKGE